MNKAIIHVALFPKSWSRLEQFAKLTHNIGMYKITEIPRTVSSSLPNRATIANRTTKYTTEHIMAVSQ